MYFTVMLELWTFSCGRLAVVPNEEVALEERVRSLFPSIRETSGRRSSCVDARICTRTVGYT